MSLTTKVLKLFSTIKINKGDVVLISNDYCKSSNNWWRIELSTKCYLGKQICPFGDCSSEDIGFFALSKCQNMHANMH